MAARDERVIIALAGVNIPAWLALTPPIFVPVIRWMTNAPNVFRYHEPYPADPRAVGINVNNVSPSACSRRHNVNLDLHPHSQWNRRRNQGAMQVNYYRLAVARQRFGDTFGLDHDL